MGGYNPWPIATLWMACYYIIAGEKTKALESFNFVTNSASKHGLLGEQVNNDGMKPSWVIGLTWSHAMYIVTLNKLIEEGIL
jgi:GH15 family glucan-1,4-alpha-glucosidase